MNFSLIEKLSSVLSVPRHDFPSHANVHTPYVVFWEIDKSELKMLDQRCDLETSFIIAENMANRKNGPISSTTSDLQDQCEVCRLDCTTLPFLKTNDLERDPYKKIGDTMCTVQQDDVNVFDDGY